MKIMTLCALRASARAVALTVGLLTLASCNIFSPLDSPSGDAQILSRARACFDQGDFDCARKYYEMLEETPQKDVALSEQAFAILDQQGAGMANFMSAFASPDGGRSVTELANAMLAVGTGPTAARRADIYRAFRIAKQMTDGTAIQGMVRFVAATALFAQLLGEEARALGQSTILRSVFADDPNACEALGTPACSVPVTNAPCMVADPASMPVGSTTYDIWDPAQTTLTETRDIRMLVATIVQIEAGLVAMDAGGSFGGLTGFSQDLIAGLGLGGFEGQCFRMRLLEQRIGN